MASPDLVAELTRNYADEQRRLSRGLLAQLLRLWRAVVRPDDFSSFQRFAELAAGLVGQHRAEATNAAARFYELFRTTQVIAPALVGAAAAEAAGTVTELATVPVVSTVSGFAPVLAPPLPETTITGDVRGAALAGFVNGRRAGQTEQQATRNAFVKASGTATRLVQNGGRDTIRASTEADPSALGWVRVTDGDPCAFCLTLASRGPEYKSAETAGRRSNARFQGEGEFKVHDHCGCSALPVFAGTPELPSTRRADETYRAAQRWARENPDQAASGTANDALNNVRRYLASQQRT